MVVKVLDLFQFYQLFLRSKGFNNTFLKIENQVRCTEKYLQYPDEMLSFINLFSLCKSNAHTALQIWNGWHFLALVIAVKGFGFSMTLSFLTHIPTPSPFLSRRIFLAIGSPTACCVMATTENLLTMATVVSTANTKCHNSAIKTPSMTMNQTRETSDKQKNETEIVTKK